MRVKNVFEKKGSPYYYYRFKKKNSDGKWLSIDIPTKVPVYKGRSKKEEEAEKEKARQIGVELAQKKSTIEERQKSGFIDRSRMTFEEYANYYLDICGLDIGTKITYLETLKKHVFPEIGQIVLCELVQQDINNYIQKKFDECLEKQKAIDEKIAEAKKKGVEAKISSSEKPCMYSIKKHRDIIRLILSNAVQDGDLTENVAKKVNKRLLDNLPKSDYEIVPYSKEDIKTLLMAIKDTKMEAVIVIASALGLRREEVLGLLWDDIKWDKNLIEIKNVVIRVNGVSSAIFRRSPKTKKSKQYLPMSNVLREYLLMLKEEQEKARELYEDYDNHTITYEDNFKQIKTLNYIEDNLDFVCRDEYGEVIKPNYVSQNFKKILEKNSLKPINFHGLRHSVGTIILEETHDLKKAQCQLRHKDIGITADTYASVMSQKYCEDTANIMSAPIGNIVNAKKNA